MAVKTEKDSASAGQWMDQKSPDQTAGWKNNTVGQTAVTLAQPCLVHYYC